MDKIETAQDRTLKLRKKMRVGSDNNGPVVVAEWVDEEIQASLKERKRNNKKWRRARREEKTKEELDRLEEEYKKQQKETSRQTGKKKGEWEKMKIEQARKSSKAIWITVKEVMGTTKSREDQVYLYTGDESKHKVEGDWEYFIDDWKKGIY